MKKGSHHKPESIEKNRVAHVGVPCPEKAKQINRERWTNNNPAKDATIRAATSTRMKKFNPMHNSASRDQMAATKAGRPLPAHHREKIKTATKEALSDPAVRKKMSESHKGVKRPQWVRDRISEGKKGQPKSEEHKKKLSETMEGRFVGKDNPFYGKNHDDDTIKIMRERAFIRENDIWYGGVKYPEDRGGTYCEKWNKEFRNRIRAFWGYRSALSGKTKEENTNHRELSCHHVYYQKKACCYWDEDSNGYYIWIEMEKYYIRGDPNKFVPLTASEHKMIDTDKKYWMMFFENLIEEKFNGKSYFTKDEMRKYVTKAS